jgi:hypothetical protein
MLDGGDSISESGHLASLSSGHIDADIYSNRCADCHEESVSTQTGGMAPPGTPAEFGGLPNHLIGVEYAFAAAKGGYRPAAALPDEMLLPDGKTSCLSCHLGYSAEHGKLTRAGVMLCNDCHIK